MSKIEAFNHRLNQSYQRPQHTGNEFRDQVDMSLRSLIRTLSSKSRACIIGAGKCKDFSLPIFIEHFSHVVLTDVDLVSIQEWDKYQHTVQIKQVEYTGFDDALFFEDFKARVATTQSYEKLDQILQQKLSPIVEYRFLEEEFHRHDVVYVSPIYTQLVYQQFLLECSELRSHGYPEHLLKYLEEKMLEEMPAIIDRFNDNVLQLLKKDGYLMVLSDIFELNNGSDFYLRVKNGIKSKDVMDEIYEGYVNKYGIGLGDYGLYNLDEKVVEQRSKWLFWPFSEERSFAVKMKIYKNTQTKGGTL
ncbi:hypothetical protein [Candidatus Xianfuyuplasma coldseepsis]|uniref:Uncharacterized protein n=1 Tax=Candidatus Xianfuyuplasma coldseepsis TaxID=2782163 RepID=A0A7L7KTD3_9MOLU|nr:hypothetical protein [Xianfuyuplasma coldseepsis]QMS85957.1 hypothetical protein G4Z02_09435 [Xianfuyuplasma coldseepsis]